MKASGNPGLPITLAQLFDGAAFDEIVRACAKFHDIGLAVVDVQGQRQVAACHETSLCKFVTRTVAGRQACDAQLVTVQTTKPAPGAAPTSTRSQTVECFTGLRYHVVPLVYEEQNLGAVIIGPYRSSGREKQKPALVRLLGRRAAKARAVVANVPILTEAQAARVVEILGRILNRLAGSAAARQIAARMHLLAVENAYAAQSDNSRRLAAAVERMQELDRLKSNFLATMSHELRTPLTSVIGYSEMLLEGLAGALNPEQREYVRTIMEKGDQLLELIGSILDVTRVEDSAPMPREPVDIGRLIGSAVAALTAQAQKKRLHMRFLASADIPRVLGDGEKLRKVLFNLLANAIKFTPRNGRIELRAEIGQMLPLEASPNPQDLDEQLGLRITVHDTGVGIERAKLSRIFEPFFQADSSSTREYGGTGLGLALVKNFVEAHGGHIWVESEPGAGSTFTVTLPVVPGDLPNSAAQVVDRPRSSM